MQVLSLPLLRPDYNEHDTADSCMDFLLPSHESLVNAT
jgi:hypothetical protein